MRKTSFALIVGQQLFKRRDENEKGTKKVFKKSRTFRE